jgi:AcrR family transcriptional regulator
MRKLAAVLGFTTMALYRYVQSKTELLTLVVDAGYANLPTIDATAGWRQQIAAWAQANQRVLLAHPWILQVPISEPPLTPNQIGWMERGLAALAGTGLREQEKLSSMLLVDVYVRGQTQLTVGVGAGIEQTEDDLHYARRLRALADPKDFPWINAALASGALEDDDQEFVIDEFAFGLETVLDGIEARMSRRRRI